MVWSSQVGGDDNVGKGEGGGRGEIFPTRLVESSSAKTT